MTGNSSLSPHRMAPNSITSTDNTCLRLRLQPTEAAFKRPLENSLMSKLPISLSQTMFQLPLRPRLHDFGDNNLAAFLHPRRAFGSRESHHRACRGNSRSPRSRCFGDL